MHPVNFMNRYPDQRNLERLRYVTFTIPLQISSINDFINWTENPIHSLSIQHSTLQDFCENQWMISGFTPLRQPGKRIRYLFTATE